MMDLITKIEMKNYNNHLQDKMKEDKLKIRNSNKVVISADETGNGGSPDASQTGGDQGQEGLWTLQG